MARVVVLGAGVAGHTAALYLRRLLPREHQVVVISPNSQWNWIPSNIWVGTGRMRKEQVLFPLAPVYRRQGIIFHQAKATALYPEGHPSATDSRPQVELEFTAPARSGEVRRLAYDYLIDATGPRLNFGATPGLGPEDGYTWSVCTAAHADQTAAELRKVIEQARAGHPQRLVVGTGHGTCTCQGAAFEYAFNVDFELRQAGVRDRCEVVYLTNEYELGDFGVGGMRFRHEGYQTTSQLWTESLFREREVKAITGAAVTRIEPGSLTYETVTGDTHTLAFDFAMLLPPFEGQPLKAYNRRGEDITDVVFAPNGFMKVDADYTPKPYAQWSAADWPKTYQNPTYPELFAAGIAFAPPHAISRPRVSPAGTPIAPAPPRTGQPAGTIGRACAESIVDRIKGRDVPLHEASMARMGASCIASTGANLRTGSAATMIMYPVVPDVQKYPLTGRHPYHTRGEIGLFGHWIKYMLHYLFIYKAKALPGWFLIPE
ncbi:FAD/NAD(P)-binding oxidoreductase [Actinomyces sp. MRS3W]|uniref:NAD(P)/FAD-dependent oxidoreductase n=1 Tax=Actinomyces sp. MRS3W TaxID=2800796 RepID=UPI0028FDB963|nr:FAD/NAD(P)-binding oxidoreductase [Actinomyces sp. MRS3W]MDU0349139.1 FAD/NAD(P)-binding oxidoreductase [Actinomyces sp. MRS3W]